MIKINPHSKRSRVITCIKETPFKIYVLWGGAARVQIRLVYMYLLNVPSVSSRYFNKIKTNVSIREIARLIARNSLILPQRRSRLTLNYRSTNLVEPTSQMLHSKVIGILVPKKIFEVYHILIWLAAWSCDRNHCRNFHSPHHKRVHMKIDFNGRSWLKGQRSTLTFGAYILSLFH